MPYTIVIQYEEKGKSPGTWIVNPEYYRRVSGEDLVELLSKLMIELVQLQRDIHNEEVLALKAERYQDDDIPF
jgi:hypothetical protein